MRVPVKTLLTRFSLDPTDFENLAHECGLESLDKPVRAPFRDPKFLRFIRHPKVLRLIRQEQRTHWKLLKDYLDQLGFWKADRVAIVDVGWQGTVQDALTYAFEELPDWPRLFGFYMGVLGDIPVGQTPRSSYEGLLFQNGGHPVEKASIRRFIELFELGANAPHATATELKQDPETGRVVPALKDDNSQSRQEERQNRDLTTRLQAGVFDFAEAYAQVLPFLEYPASRHTDFFLAQLDRFLRLPRAVEGRAFSRYQHVDDFGLDTLRKSYLPEFKSPTWFNRAKALSGERLWPEATLASYGGFLMVSLFNLYRIVRTREY